MRLAPHCSLEMKQLLLYIESATVTAELVVAGDHAMARNNDRNRVVVVRHSDGTKATRTPDGARQVGVRTGLSVRDFEQRIPAAQLEVGAAEIERDRELREF